MTASLKNMASISRIVSSGWMPSACESSVMACGTPPAASIQGISASRLRIVSRTSSRKVTSAAARTAAASAWPSGLSGCTAACSITPRLSSSSSCASVGSSSTSKRAATLASNGNRCRSWVQKPWMVCTLRPPGVSSASANNCRARRRSAAEGRPTPAACIAASRPASSRRVHLRNSSNTRFAMLAAAALVKVMQRMRAGSTPDSSSRITRCASTWVLPEPALAATKAE